jgi:hypothetical protein
VTITVADIETMDRAALVAAWSEVFQTRVPKGLSQSFLRRFLAFEVQARRFGGLPKGFVEGLDTRSEAKSGKSSRRLKPGGRLLREWNGVTHSVEVVEDGFRWNGDTYRSLSSVARAITGARWSGPRFFGLTEGPR